MYIVCQCGASLNYEPLPPGQTGIVSCAVCGRELPGFDPNSRTPWVNYAAEYKPACYSQGEEPDPTPDLEIDDATGRDC
jgi:hypothetical protein